MFGGILSKNKLPLGMAWDCNHLRVADLQKQGEGYDLNSIEYSFPEKIIEDGHLMDMERAEHALKNMKKEFKWGKRRVVLSTPLEDTIVLYFKLPEKPLEELEKAIIQEAKVALGNSPENYIFDYMILGREITQGKGAKLNILVAATYRSLIEDFLQLYQELGLNLVAVDVVPLALKRALTQGAACDGDGNFVILDLGLNYNQLAAIHQGQLSFSRFFSSDMLTTKEEKTLRCNGAMDHKPIMEQSFITEIKQTLDYFRRQNRKEANYVIVSGYNFQEERLGLLQKHLKAKIVTGIPGVNLNLSPNPHPKFATALGLALKGVVA